MNLQGYDTAVEVSRGTINQVLERMVNTRYWPHPFSGAWESPTDDKNPLQTSVKYHFALIDPYIAPSEFPTKNVHSAIEANATVKAGFRVDCALEGSPIHHFEQDVQAQVALDIRLSLESDDQYIYLTTEFSSVRVRRIDFGPGVPEHVASLIRFVTESLLTNRINAKPWKVPVLPRLSLELPFLGRIQSLGFKSHWYRSASGDLAAGLGLIFDEASRPVPPEGLLALRRSDGGGDLVISTSITYLNLCLNRALQQGDLLSRYDEHGNPHAHGKLRVQSATLRVVESRLRVDVKIAVQGMPIFHIEAHLFLAAVKDRFETYVAKINGDIPGTRLAATRVTINSVFLLALWTISRLSGKDTQSNISDRIEKILNDKNLMDPFDGPIFDGGPEIRVTPSLFQCDDTTLAMSFRVATV